MGSLSWDTQLAWDFLLRLFWPTLRERTGFLLIATQAAKKAETRHVNYEFQRVRHNCCNLLGGFKFLVLFHTDPNICQDSERNCGFETTNQWWIDSEGPEFVTWFRGIFSMNARPPAAVFSKSLATLALRSERLEPCGIVWKLVRKNPFHSLVNHNLLDESGYFGIYSIHGIHQHTLFSDKPMCLSLKCETHWYSLNKLKIFETYSGQRGGSGGTPESSCIPDWWWFQWEAMTRTSVGKHPAPWGRHSPGGSRRKFRQ